MLRWNFSFHIAREGGHDSRHTSFHTDQVFLRLPSDFDTGRTQMLHGYFARLRARSPLMLAFTLDFMPLAVQRLLFYARE